jgi:hypothetical protein
VGRRITSARVRTHSTGPARRFPTLQRCDATGPTRPARRIGPSNLGHRCVGADRRVVRPFPPTWVSAPHGSDSTGGKDDGQRLAAPPDLLSRPVASIYAATLVACCAAQRMAMPLQYRCFGLRASNQCLDGFLNRSWLASSSHRSSPPFFSTQSAGAMVRGIGSRGGRLGRPPGRGHGGNRRGSHRGSRGGGAQSSSLPPTHGRQGRRGREGESSHAGGHKH